MSGRILALPVSLLLSTALLAGCGMGLSNGGTAVTPASIQGVIRGGEQAVTGASVTMYAVNTSGYGLSSASEMTASATTDGNGGFNLAGDYTCPSNDALTYIVAKGGNPGMPGTVDNQQIVLMAVLGKCGNLGSTQVVINEMTTVAAVWALAPFMTAYDHVGTSPGNVTGLANAFAMADTLVDPSIGASPGNAPANSVIPTSELNTLADILSGCVNTTGGSAGDGTPCGNLFNAAKVGSVAPTNIADAALNVALHPSTDIWGELPPGVAPFQPMLSSKPNDWTVAANFSIGSRTTSSMAFDASGNLWVEAPDALYELNPQGAVLGSYPSMAGNGVAIDATGNIWVTTATNTLNEMPSTLGTPAVYAAPNTPNIGVDGLALDGFGNAWYTCDTCSAVYELGPSGSYTGSFPVASSVHQTNLSIDPSENVWMGNYDYAQINVFQNSGTPLSGSPLSCGACGHPAFVANDASGNAWITGNNLTKLVPGTGPTNFAGYPTLDGGLYNPSAVAIDGAGNAWVANAVGISTANPTAGSLSEFTNAGGVVTPDYGYVSDTLATPLSIAVDGSGSVWMRNSGSATVTAFVGAGVPVVTPLALGVKNGQLGSRP